MMQHTVHPNPGAHKRAKRLGRGSGSGSGDYSGKGRKGQKARSGGGVRRGFEGGQLALIKRMPSKRGFTNKFKIRYSVVNLKELSRLPENTEVTPQLLARLGLSAKPPVKILGDGGIGRALIFKQCKLSQAARSKVEAAGGRVED